MEHTFIILAIVTFGVVGLIGTLMRMTKQAETDLLDKMFNNNDINDSVYKKYKK